MRITQIESYFVHAIQAEGGETQRPILVKIETDEGIYGVGEVGMAYGKGGRAAFGMLTDYAGMLIGMDPMNTEAIWEKLLKQTFWGQGGGTVIFGGMSGLDMALWDIKGKALGVPVYQLLGGKCREDLRVYASQIQLGWGPKRIICKDPEEYAEQARIAVAEGYDAVKADVLQFDRTGKSGGCHLEGPLPPHVIRMGVERIAAIREAVGPDVDIIVENHAHTDTTSGIQFAQAIEPYNIYFYEEPNMNLNPDMLRCVREKPDLRRFWPELPGLSGSGSGAGHDCWGQHPPGGNFWGHPPAPSARLPGCPASGKSAGTGTAARPSPKAADGLCPGDPLLPEPGGPPPVGTPIPALPQPPGLLFHFL